jgi:hypothetical protein
MLPSEKQASGFRKYFMEYTILSLVVAVITLFGLYYNLNKFVVETVLNDKIRTEQIIERNTDAIQLLISSRK